MAYYPIKCVRCAQILTNDTVLFDTSDTVLSLAQQMGVVQEEEFEEQKPMTISTLDSNEEESVPSDNQILNSEDMQPQAASERKKHRFTQKMTYAQIKAYCDENGGTCRPSYQSVTVTPDFYDSVPASERDEDLLVKVTFRKDRNDKEKQSIRRFCPCCNCEIPSQSGAMPTYNVTLMGTSASGKTVYLCALNHALMYHKLGALPYGGNLSCISASRSNTDLLKKSNLLFDRGVLPGTTQMAYTEPLVVQITFTMERLGKRKKCLLALSDMRGEDFITETGDNLQQKAEIFASADAFLMLVSPLNMGLISTRLSGDEADEEYNTGVHDAMLTNISEYILPHFSDSVITVPSSIMLSKCDQLMNNKELLAGLVQPFNPVVLPEPTIRYTGTYFRSQHEGTQAVLKTQPQLFNSLLNMFHQAYYTSFSSLGTAANVEVQEVNGGPEEETKKEKKVTNPNAINPIRVLDSMIYILMRLGFLPEYYKIEYGNQFEDNNSQVLRNWVDNCT